MKLAIERGWLVMHESGTFVRFGPANPKHPAIPAGDKRQGNLLHWKPLGLSPIDGMGIGKTGRSIDPPDGHPRPTHSRLMWRKSHKDDAGRSVIAVATLEVGGGGESAHARRRLQTCNRVNTRAPSTRRNVDEV